jgi:hypothetical protein
MKRLNLSAVWMLLLVVSPLAAQEDAKKPPVDADAPAVKKSDSKESAEKAEDKDKKAKTITPDQAVDICKKLEKSMVIVEYELKFDKGEEPSGAAYVPGTRYIGELVRQERPLEVPAFLISPTEVIASDPIIHPRFIKSINVRIGDKKIPAKPAKYLKKQYGMIFKLETPAEGPAALKFDSKVKKPYKIVTVHRINTRWTLQTRSMPSNVLSYKHGAKSFRKAPEYCVITDRNATPVGMYFITDFPVDDSWKGSPGLFPAVAAEKLTAMLDSLQTTVDGGLFRITLQFRSPKKQAGGRSYYGGGESETEKQVLGVLIDPGTILVLADLKPKVTARLERILVNIPGQKSSEAKPVEAKFSVTLKDYGCLVAKLEKPMDGPITLSDQNILKYEDLLLPMVEVRLQGAKRVTYFNRTRISGYSLGWKKHIYPRVLGNDDGRFVFDTDGQLLVLPVVRREKGQRSRYGGDGDSRPTASVYIKEVMADLKDNIDLSNVPLSEEEENRLAWLGVSLQPLNRELARANKVSDETDNGRTGALVSYVYPDSPAEKAGVTPGYILLRIHAEDQPKPIDIQVEDHGGRGPFPWDRLEGVPEQYYDRIPKPWPSAENNFTRTLTDLGFGKKFTADFFFRGKIVKKEFTVTQSPRHYDTAKKFKSKPAGLTVRNLTYELRRYFRTKKDEKGVIISKIEPGSKASVAGLKPYEIITDVNDKPVMNAEDFEKLIAEGGELQLAVKRWTKGRVVKIELDAPKAESDEEDKDKEDKDDGDKGKDEEDKDKEDKDDGDKDKDEEKSESDEDKGKDGPGSTGGDIRGRIGGTKTPTPDDEKK